MSRSIIIGSRGSQLALVQAELMLSLLSKANPRQQFSITKIVTEGDTNRHLPLGQLAGVGIFVKELETALLDGRIDIAVHSLKDMPTEVGEGLCLAAVTSRLDPRDVLVSKHGKLAELASGSRIGTSSLRRAAQLAAHRPDLEVCSLRGNVNTRLQKALSGELDGVILAAAALIRLGWEDRISEYLSIEHFLPPAGQGALGIEVRADDEEATRLVASLNHLPTRQSVDAERAFISVLGGGCHAPIGALGTVTDNTLKLTGMVADASDKKTLNASEESDPGDSEQIGIRLAQKMLKMGAAKIINEGLK